MNPESREWIEHTIRSLVALETQIGDSYDYWAPLNCARESVSRIPQERVPHLIVTLFDAYDAHRNETFGELMWLVQALYESLPTAIPTEEACAILAATRHSCGHGGVESPIDLARRSFENRPYTPEFFEAVRTYRGRLKGLRTPEVTRTLGEIAMLLWQDPSEPLRPRDCMSRGLREGFFALPEDRRGLWTQLLRYVDRSARHRPDRKWEKAVTIPFRALGSEAFAADLAQWLSAPKQPVVFSTGGRHVIKSVIWFASLSESDQLDDVLPRLIDLEYAEPEAAVPLIYAVGHWLSSRPLDFAESHYGRLREKWPIAGTRVKVPEKAPDAAKPHLPLDGD
jgi:hypothetical protein